MDLVVKFDVVLELTQAELKLVGRALAGKIKQGTPEHKEALVLNTKLMQAQEREIKERLDVVESAKNNAIDLLQDVV